jgi:hypothetical protein
MAVGEPMWKTILQAAESLGAGDGRTFSRAKIIATARRLDASHHEMAYGAMLQTMVIEAPTAPASPVGKVFHRIGRGNMRCPPSELVCHPIRRVRHQHVEHRIEVRRRCRRVLRFSAA